MKVYPCAIFACLSTVHHIERQNRLESTSKEQRWQSIIHLSIGLRLQVLCKFFVNRFGHRSHGESANEVSPFSSSAFCEVRTCCDLFCFLSNKLYRALFQSRTCA